MDFYIFFLFYKSNEFYTTHKNNFIMSPDVIEMSDIYNCFHKGSDTRDYVRFFF